MASEKAVNAAELIEDVINTFGGQDDAEHIVNHLLFMHRTLNQAFTSRIIIPFIREMAKMYTNDRCDARNETACRICRVMFDALKREYLMNDDDEALSLAMI